MHPRGLLQLEIVRVNIESIGQLMKIKRAIAHELKRLIKRFEICFVYI